MEILIDQILRYTMAVLDGEFHLAYNAFMKKKLSSKHANGNGIGKEIRDLAGIVKENSVDIRRIGVMVEENNDKIELVAEQYGDIKKTLDSHTEMIGSIATDVEIIKTDIEFIKSSLKKKVDAEEFAALERRVTVLERRK